VVNIRTTRHERREAGDGDDEARELFRRHFGVPAPRAPRADPDGDDVQRGVASGFVVSSDGVVYTNAHVVEGAEEVFVRLTDQREFKARVIGADKRSDVAVLKIDATGLPAMRFGDVAQMKVGEWVIAIGSPFNLDNTVTAGIVSAKARDTGDLVPFIQTDVAINPGNSGGPLINLRGEVVGINSQIYSRSGGYQGISFAIPVDEAQRIAGELRLHGRVVRGRIGVRIGEMKREVALALGLPRASGALVQALEPDGPADKAGILAGDIITRYDGGAIDTWSDLPRAVSKSPPGTQGRVQVLRNGVLKEIPVRIGELEPPEQLARAELAVPEAPPRLTRAAAIGLRLSELSAQARQALKLKSGLRVEDAGGPAAHAGLRPGDILLGLANTEVSSVAQVETLLAHLDTAKPLSLLYSRESLVQYGVIPAAR
jgi:serine protease Do